MANFKIPPNYPNEPNKHPSGPSHRRLLVSLVTLLVLFFTGVVPSGIEADQDNHGSKKFPPGESPTPSEPLLTAEERSYLDQLGPVTVCPDPDWLPYAQMDGNGNFTGIAADLIKLIAERLEVTFTYVQAKDWDEAIKLSQAGKVLVLPFLNQTPTREKWLIFTEPLFLDPNVFITREEHAFITNAALLQDETIAMPSGTSIEEKITNDFPNLRIITTGNSESEVFKAIAERRADLTLRSLTVSAYTIRQGGWFTLKIAGQASDEYVNRLRIGVLNSEPMLRDILNKGIATITPQEREEITNRHVNITVVKPMDYGFVLRIAAGLTLLVGLSFYWNLRLQKTNAALQESERSKSVLLSNLPGMAYRCRFDHDWTMEFISDGCLALTGYSSNDLVMNNLISFNDLIVPECRQQLRDTWQTAVDNRQSVRVEFRITTFDKKEKWVLEQGVPIFDKQGTIQAIEGIIIDISELKQVEEQMQHMARYDNLTALPNRALFTDRTERALLNAQRNKDKSALFFIDLDKFKPINDELGHNVGDWLLQAVAQRMTISVRKSDTVARIGGDEFAVLLPTIARPEDAYNVAEKIRCALNNPFVTAEGISLAISCSIGVALYPEHGDKEQDLLRAADEAMYSAKKKGGNAIEFCRPGEPKLAEFAGNSITRLIWKPEYLSGIQAIDREHQQLFQMANRLFSQLISQKSDPALFNAALTELLQHIFAHFDNEEALLRRAGYSEVEEHTAQHTLLKERAITLQQVAAERDLSAGELLDFLTINVVYDHLLDMDQRYFEFLRRQHN